MRNIVMIGVDGASWSEIEKLIAEGKLPNLKYLIDNGVSGKLESLDPAYTPIIWTGIATGKNPASHGVRYAISTRHDIKTLTIWDIVEDNAGKIGIFNYPVTWPPRKTNGFIIPEPPISEKAFPSELKFIVTMRKIGIGTNKIRGQDMIKMLKLLMKGLTNGLTMSTLGHIVDYLTKRLHIREEEILESERALLGQLIFTDLYLMLHKRFKPVFSAFYLDAVDVIAHNTWKYYEPCGFVQIEHRKSEKYGRYVPESYINTDKCIGSIIDSIDNETALIIVSDHGTRSATKGNTKLSLNATLLFEKLGIRKKIDYFYCDGTTYFSVKERNEEDEALEKLRSFGEKYKVFSVKDSADVPNLYSLAIEEIEFQQRRQNEGHTLRGKSEIDLSKLVKPNEYKISGIHDKYGIFILFGPNVKRGYNMGIIQVTEITPTLLYYLGLPVGEDMDGAVVTPIFNEEFVKNNEIKYIETYDIQERIAKYLGGRKVKIESSDNIKARLKALGYLD